MKKSYESLNNKLCNLEPRVDTMRRDQAEISKRSNREETLEKSVPAAVAEINLETSDQSLSEYEKKIKE